MRNTRTLYGAAMHHADIGVAPLLQNALDFIARSSINITSDYTPGQFIYVRTPIYIEIKESLTQFYKVPNKLSISDPFET